MLTSNQINIGSIVSFDLYPAQIFGTSIKRVKVLGVVSASIAMTAGFDVPAYHTMVMPTLPPGSPSQYNGYSYLCYEKLDSSSVSASERVGYIGLPWIREETFQVHLNATLRFTFENITPEAQNLIAQAVAGVGFTPDLVETL